MRFFFYGTLMDPDVRSAVLGRAAGRITVQPAILAGFRRVHAPGKSWPVLVRAAGGRVEGVLAQDIDPPLARTLIRYEGTAYRLDRCRVRTASREVLPAAVFLPRTPPAGGRNWRHDAWLARDKAAFLGRLSSARAGGAWPTAESAGR